jgi:hypothetical protein
MVWALVWLQMPRIGVTGVALLSASVDSSTVLICKGFVCCYMHHYPCDMRWSGLTASCADVMTHMSCCGYCHQVWQRVHFVCVMMAVLGLIHTDSSAVICLATCMLFGIP